MCGISRFFSHVFAYRRLSIIDLSDAGIQPMSTYERLLETSLRRDEVVPT